MSNNTKPLPSVDEIMDLIGVLQTYPRADDSEARVRAALTQLHMAAVSGLASIERPKRLGVYARVVHELIHPDNGHCNQCGGHWLYRTDGSWEYTEGEHTPSCVFRRLVEESTRQHSDDLPFPDATTPDPDAENDPSLRDLETVCAWCGMAHHHEGTKRNCGCQRHIDGAIQSSACNAARVGPDSVTTSSTRGAKADGS
jgi:hypothetical protein